MLTKMNKDRAIIITGKHGTGKSTKAKEMLGEPIVLFANEMNIKSVGSIPKEIGIVIEDIHYKPKVDDIIYLLRTYRGEVVLTSINQKSVPVKIKNMCKFKRAGTTQYAQEAIEEIAPRSEKPFTLEKDMFSLVLEYMKSSDRDLISEMLQFNKPPDTQIMSWLVENIHPNRLVFIDSVVKRRWNSRYFYELLAYSFAGKNYTRPRMPSRGKYSQMPNLCRRVGLRGGDERLFKQLLNDENFVKMVKKKLNNAECRLVGIGEKKIRKEKKKVKKMTLDKWL